MHRFTIFGTIGQNSLERTNVSNARTPSSARQDTIIMESVLPVNPTNC